MWDVLGKIGILITLVQSFLLLLKRFRKEKELTIIENAYTFFITNWLKLFNGVKILYNNKTVKDNLVLYRATIYNSGEKDLDNSSQKPLIIKLPQEYKWKNFEIIEKSNALCIHKTAFNDSSVEITFNEMRRDEYLRFEALLEYNNPSLNEYNISQHRPLSFCFNFDGNRICDLFVKPKDIRKREMHISIIFSFLLLLDLAMSLFLLKPNEDDYIYTSVVDSIKTQSELIINSNSQQEQKQLANRIKIDSTQNPLIEDKNIIDDNDDKDYEEIELKSKVLTYIYVILMVATLSLWIEKIRICLIRNKINQKYKGMWLPFTTQMFD